MKIGVLCGGVSSEREISLASGEAVYQALLRNGCHAVRVDIVSADEAREQILKTGIDFAFIALHGFFGEDGRIQGILEEIGIPYSGSGVEASRLAMDKARTKGVLRGLGIMTPAGFVLKAHAPHPAPDRLPVVVKPSDQGSSLGASIVHSKGEWDAALKNASRFGGTVLVEDYISGEELTVGILEDGALPIVRLILKREFYDYQAKYEPGWTLYEVPASLEAGVARAVQEAALKTHRAVGASGFSRVDIRLDAQGSAWVLELNTIPGFTDKSLLPKAAAQAGISFDDLVLKIIRYALEREMDAYKEQSA
ncbi:MAG: D-alanine--D-alanine ligase [Candidatus Omnitrophica bacterium]|nr:D-alanine--D-alanine ligase [Candidatus Omnitrophota bacterium]